LFNFLEIAAQLRTAGALSEVVDADELSQRVAHLWREPEIADAMRTAGQAVMQANQGALARLLVGLGRLIMGKP
jgi:3-deoxy-D-manno-octulosonic-acid transferase